MLKINKSPSNQVKHFIHFTQHYTHYIPISSTELKPKSKSKKSIFEKSNPYYQSQSEMSQPGTAPNDNNENTEDTNNKADVPQGPYFDPILNKLATYHPEV